MAQVTMEVDDDLLDDVVRVEGETDERGRLTLGTGYSHTEVEVIIVEAEQIRSQEAQSAD